MNEIRRNHPTVWSLRDIRFHHSDNEQLLVYTRGHVDDDLLLVVVTLDPHHAAGDVRAPRPRRRRPARRAATTLHDELTGDRYTWEGDAGYVRLDPTAGQVAHLFHVTADCPASVARQRRDAMLFAHRRRRATVCRCVVVPALMAVNPPIDPADERWYQHAVFYEVLVRGFYDGNGDGTGDLTGLTQRLDYLRVARDRLHLAAALLRLAAARRRLRHLGLLQPAPGVRRHRRRGAVPRGGAQARHAGRSPTW